MWTCPKCERVFKNNNQAHMCTGKPKDVGELFLDKPDHLVIAYDDIISGISGWQPMHVGAAAHSVIVTSQQAWLIIKPMNSWLDVKFYTGTEVDSELIRKTDYYSQKYGNYIRIKQPFEVTPEVFRLLRRGFDYSMDN